MLEIRNLSVCFKEKKVLENLNLEVNPSEVLGIIGKNGAGKTTLFESIYQSVKYTGEILWNGSQIKRHDISYLETENYFYPYINGNEYLKYFGKADEFQILAERFSLPLKKFVHEYSHGMKKKLALTAVLLLDKPLIILDEPFNGVDFESVHLMYDIISELKQKGKTVLISSHIIETLYNTCDRIAVLKDGNILENFDQQRFTQLQNLKF